MNWSWEPIKAGWVGSVQLSFGSSVLQRWEDSHSDVSATVACSRTCSCSPSCPWPLPLVSTWLSSGTKLQKSKWTREATFGQQVGTAHFQSHFFCNIWVMCFKRVQFLRTPSHFRVNERALLLVWQDISWGRKVWWTPPCCPQLRTRLGPRWKSTPSQSTTPSGSFSNTFCAWTRTKTAPTTRWEHFRQVFLSSFNTNSKNVFGVWFDVCSTLCFRKRICWRRF